jgi:hypothetical protein
MIEDPIRMIGIFDSFFADMKPSLSGCHANQTRAANSPKRSPNGFRMLAAVGPNPQNPPMAKTDMTAVIDILAIMSPSEG